MRTLRRFILLFAIAIMLFTMVPLTANTEDWIPSGFKDFVFDAKFYAAKYPDVAAECGDSEDSLYAHFLKKGALEGKQGSATFSVAHYLYFNADLKAKFGTDYKAAILHYCSTSSPSTQYQSAPNKYFAGSFDAVISCVEGTSQSSFNLGVADTAMNEANAKYNVQVSTANIKDNKQIWTFKIDTTDNSYIITNKYTGSVLDVNGRGKTNNTNVSTYKSNGSTAQKWRLYQRLPGQFVLAPVHTSGFAVLDVGNSVANGTNAKLYQYNHTNAQLFNIQVLIPEAIKSVVFDHEYYASKYPSVATEYGSSQAKLYEHFTKFGLMEGKQASPVFSVVHYLQNNSSVLSKCGNHYTAAMLHYYSTGRNTKGLKTAPAADLGSKFEATINHTSANINIGIASTATNTDNNAWNVQTVAASDTDAKQIWVFTRNADGSYTLTNKAYPNAAMDTSGVAIADATNIATYTNTGVDDEHRHWYFFERTPGNYVISPAHSSGKVVDISGGGITANKNIQLYTYNYTPAQYYKISILNYTSSTDSIWYKTLTPNDSFTTPLYPSDADKHTLLSYDNISLEKYKAVYDGFVDRGFEIYSDSVKGKVYATTFVDGEDFYHVYWSYSTRQLRIAEAFGSSDCLPSRGSVVPKGKIPTITQLSSTYLNGMGYIITLSDGSFIIVDGGYSDEHDKVYNKLVELNGGSKDGIIIRAWLITHAHNDHYECFVSFAKKYASAVTLEYFMYCPETPATRRSGWGGIFTWGEIYDYINLFSGTKTLIVHTGMEFKFGDVYMEILYAPDDMIIDFIPDNQNEYSIVSRFYTKTKSALLLGDAGNDVATRFEYNYGTYLKSDICQAAHHGVEDFPLSTYNLIKAPIMFYPCDQELYDSNSRFNDVREAIASSDYIKEILIHQHGHYTRPLATEAEKPEPEQSEEYGKIKGVTLTIGNDLSLNYYADITEKYHSAKLRLTQNGVTTIVEGIETGNANEFKFTYKGVAPQNMGDNILAELIFDGEVLSVLEEYSIKTYCQKTSTKTNNKLILTFLADILEYGAAAQEFKNYKTDELVNDVSGLIPTEYQALEETDRIIGDRKSETSFINGLGVYCDYKNNIYVNFITNDLSNVAIRVNGVIVSKDLFECLNSSTGQYKFMSDAIYATGFNDIYTIELLEDGNVVQTVKYSVKSYIYSMQNQTGSDGSLTALAKISRALYNYGQSAIAYKSSL